MNYVTNFDRQYRIIIGNSGSAFELGGGDHPLHVAFEIQKADTQANNSARINVWNLNKEHISMLEKSDCRVLLRAGYGTRLATIFEGTVNFASTTMEGADRKTEIELVDSLKSTRDGFVSVSYSEPVSWKRIMDDVATQMGVVVSYSYNATFVQMESGLSFVGKGADLISKGCNSCGLSWTIQDGILQIKKPNDVMKREVYIINKDTGMVGIPARVALEKSKTTVKKLGWDVSFLMNGSIGVNDYVKVESDAVTSFFKVYSITHSGDNVSGDWVSTARLETIS